MPEPQPNIARSSPSSQLCGGVAAICLALLGSSPALAADTATIRGGTYTIDVGERASFPVRTRSDRSSEFSGWCELTSAGSASVVFDGRHYVPLSEPSVGDVINFNRPTKRRFEMTGTFEASSGDASISFFFASVPVAFCFGGGDCATVGEGSGSVIVACGQY